MIELNIIKIEIKDVNNIFCYCFMYTDYKQLTLTLLFLNSFYDFDLFFISNTLSKSLHFTTVTVFFYSLHRLAKIIFKK